MTDRELLELIASQVGNLTTQVDALTSEMGTHTSQLDTLALQINGLTKDMAGVKTELTEVKAIVVKIENDHGQKLSALLDGYKQNAERLDRIEAIVAKHEEFILGRLK